MGRFEEAVKAAEPLNPDGWAADPEALLAGVTEHLWEFDHFHGRDEAVAEARRMWHVHVQKFKEANSVSSRGYWAAHVLEIEKVGAALTKGKS